MWDYFAGAETQTDESQTDKSLDLLAGCSKSPVVCREYRRNTLKLRASIVGKVGTPVASAPKRENR